MEIIEKGHLVILVEVVAVCLFSNSHSSKDMVCLTLYYSAGTISMFGISFGLLFLVIGLPQS